MGRAASVFVPLLSLLLGTPASPAAGAGAPPTSREGYGLLRRLLSPDAGERRAASRRLSAGGDRSLVPGLVDLLFFLPTAQRTEAISALEALTGESTGARYHDWVELVGRRSDLAPRPGYLAFKGELLARLDPRYAEILDPRAPLRIRPEEIVWGGVKVEGIPALDRPASQPASEAAYLDDAEKVFGVSLAGVQRAYPLRTLSWHEMVNDEVGGEPITLSFCTLCGSGVLYSARNGSGPPYTFGTSGLLYRSNKLMLDRQTGTLWNNLTGEAVLGRLAQGPARLAVLPLTVTTWGEWRARHPKTTVLALDREAERRFGYRYVPGAADRQRAGVRFPVWLHSGALDDHAEVYAVRLDGSAKAYAVTRVLKEGLVHDRLGDRDLLLVGDPASGAVRAYARDGRRFVPGGRPDELRDEKGELWRIDEEALVPLGTSPGAVPLPRLPGHQAFWFGWYAFFPHTELYGGTP